MPDVPYILSDPEDGAQPISPLVISITEDALLDAIGAFVRKVLPGVPVMRGQDNRVPEPLAVNHIIITPRMRAHLATTTHESDITGGRIAIARSTRADVQIDIYGPTSTDNAQVFTTLLRDRYGIDAFAGTGVAPLYCNDGHQMPLVNGEAQYEDRWTVQTAFQITPSVFVPAQFMDEIDAIPVLADA